MPPKAKKPTNVGVLNVEQLLDLALGGQEPGIINFNLLHYILYIMAQELGICDMPIEFLGDEAVKIRKLVEATKFSPAEVQNKPKGFVSLVFDDEQAKNRKQSKDKNSRVTIQDTIQEERDNKENYKKETEKRSVSKEREVVKRPETNEKEIVKRPEVKEKEVVKRPEVKEKEVAKRPETKGKEMTKHPEVKEKDTGKRSSSKDKDADEKGKGKSKEVSEQGVKYEEDDVEEKKEKVHEEINLDERNVKYEETTEAEEVEAVEEKRDERKPSRRKSKDQKDKKESIKKNENMEKKVDKEKTEEIKKHEIRERTDSKERDESRLSSFEGKFRYEPKRTTERRVREERKYYKEASEASFHDQPRTSMLSEKKVPSPEKAQSDIYSSDVRKELHSLSAFFDRGMDDRRRSYRVNTSDIELPKTAYFGVKVDKEEYDQIKQECDFMRTQMDELRLIVEGTAGVMQEHQGILKEGANLLELFTMLNAVKRLEAIETTMESLMQQHNSSPEIESEYANSDLGGMTMKEALLYIYKKLMKLKIKVDGLNISDRFFELEEQINHLDNVYNNQLASIMVQISDLQRNTAEVLKLTSGTDQLVDLLDKFAEFELKVKAAMQAADALAKEKGERDRAIQILQEQIEFLKCIKVNREEMEEALAEKADLCMISKKVSYETFDTATDDLTKSIEEALRKLNAQENLWLDALNDLDSKVGKKADKGDIMPIRDFINTKLGQLHDKLKTLSEFKKEREGSATKYLKNVNCVACDADIVMRKTLDEKLKVQPEQLPPIQTMGPYLAYELDNIRKQQKQLPGRNLNYFEKAITEKEKEAKDHICNRYCGGDHTTTTPQQRVTRLGHFLEQWGPDVAAAAGNTLRGKDGMYYKGSEKSPKLKDPQSETRLQSPLPALESKTIPLTSRRYRKDGK